MPSRRLLALVAASGLVAGAACTGGGHDDGADGDAVGTGAACEVDVLDTTSDSGSTTSTTPEADMYTSSNTPIATLLADPAAKAVLEEHLPQLANSSNVDLIGQTTLKGIQGYAAALVTDEVLAAIDEDLAELEPLTPEEGGGPLDAGVNYNEAKVAPYVLPNALVLEDGEPVCDAETWYAERRPEIFEVFEEEVYGHAPDRPEDQHFDVVEPPTPAFDGTALRSQVTIALTDEADGPSIDLVEYVPAGATGPVPMLLALNFLPTSQQFGDPDLVDGAAPTTLPGVSGPEVPLADLLAAGFGVAGINFLQLDPDTEDGYRGSLRAYFDGGDEEDRPPDAWGAIAAWGWGLSRAQDYLETDPAVDSDRVAIYGASRLGSAVLWAAARDERFAAVIACCSGKRGGGLLRRGFGGRADMAPAHWNAANLQDHLADIDALPVDGHMLLALIAPRPVLLQTGWYDHAADPKGEFLAAIAASPVYELLGGEGLGATEEDWPPAEPLLNDIGYYVHGAGHGPTAESWPIFVEFLEAHLAG